MSGSPEKVQGSPHFDKEITLWKSHRREDKMRHLGGLTRRCDPSGIVESKYPFATSGDIDYYSFISQSPLLELLCDFAGDAQILDCA
jgi:hypothetical protein